MFKVIDACVHIYDAYGTFVDHVGDVQFILCRNDGEFFRTHAIPGFYKLYRENGITQDQSSVNSSQIKDIEKLFSILTELYARETNGNILMPEKGYIELCDNAIELFHDLKEGYWSDTIQR